MPRVTGQHGEDWVGYGLARDAGWQGLAAEEIAADARRQRCMAGQMTGDDQLAQVGAIDDDVRRRALSARLRRAGLFAVARWAAIDSIPGLLRRTG